MSSDQRAQGFTTAEVAALVASHQALEAQVDQLKHQLEWFKKQLFGRKSERRKRQLNGVIAPEDQVVPGAALRRSCLSTAAA